MALKRYLVFVGQDYYPAGGWQDFSNSFDTIAEAREDAATHTPVACKGWMWSHIVDTTTGEEVSVDAVDEPDEDVDAQMDDAAELQSSPPPDPAHIAALRAKIDAVRPKPAALSAALVARAFSVMLPKHAASLTLEHNDHKSYYQTVEQHIADLGREPDWVSPVERQKALATGELWTLHWYPETPIGSHRICAASLDAIAQWLEDNGMAFGS